MAPGGDLQAEITYGNHLSSKSHTGAIRAKSIQDIVSGRALAFTHLSVSDIRGLHISHLGAVDGGKLRIIHDVKFAEERYRSSVNDDTYSSAAPPCERDHVYGDVCRRILYLLQRHRAVARAMLCSIDVKDAFAPNSCRPPAFGEYAVVDFLLQFGWRSSPGYWNLVQPDEFLICGGF